MDRLRKLVLAGAKASGESKRIEFDEDVAVVTLPGGRVCRVGIMVAGEYYRFTVEICPFGKTGAESVAELLQVLWSRNRATEIATLDIENGGLVIARFDALSGTLDPAEAYYYVTTIAREAEDLKYRLTGRV